MSAKAMLVRPRDVCIYTIEEREWSNATITLEPNVCFVNRV